MCFGSFASLWTASQTWRFLSYALLVGLQFAAKIVEGEQCGADDRDNGADIQPLRLTRHEAARQVARSLQSPDDADDGEKAAEDVEAGFQ